MDIIDWILLWIGHKSETESEVISAGADAMAKSCTFWINGSARTGKTTIGCTIAKACSKKNILGVSFFCSHHDVASSNPKLIFTTIAYQLGHCCPSFGDRVTDVLKSYPDKGYSDLSYQLEQLILHPPLAVVDSFLCMVIMDALDECKDDKTTSLILASLFRHSTNSCHSRS